MSSLGMLVALRPAHLSFSGSRWAGKVEIVVRVTVGNSHLAIYCKGDGEPVSRLHSVNSVRHTATCRGFTAEDAESAERKKVESGEYGASLGRRATTRVAPTGRLAMVYFRGNDGFGDVAGYFHSYGESSV